MRDELAARLIARAALYGAPDTPVSAGEVAFALGRCENLVRERRPATAYVPEGGRAIVAPWRDWVQALGYGDPEPPESEDAPTRRAAGDQLQPRRPRGRRLRARGDTP